MGELIAMDDAYRTWIADLKSCYRQLQIRAAVSVDSISPNLPQVVEILIKVPWGHHRFIIDRCGGNSAKALFYVQKTLEHGWSRNALLNHLDTNLFERYGRGINNFALTMPPNDSDLIRETIRDPYHFAFAEIAETGEARDVRVSGVLNV